jgi:serine phosphatase RsbU (regulator of sigma subunit)
MTGLLTLIEFVGLAAAVLFLAHRERARTRSDRTRVARLFIGMSLYAALTVAWIALVSSRDATLDSGRGLGLPGVLWLTQLLRLGALAFAGAAWWGLAAPSLLEKRRRIVALVLFTFVLGQPLGGAAFAGFLGLVVLLRRQAWPEAIHGPWRIAGLVLAPILFAVAVATPILSIDGSTLNISLSPGAGPRPPALLTGDVTPAEATELAITRPLDRIVAFLLAPLAAQMLLLFLQFLTLPVRLTGLSLSRRLAVNYFLIRVVPGFLGTLLLIVAVYLVLGLNKAARVQGAFEATLERSRDIVRPLLADSTITAAGGDADRVRARLEAARIWLGDSGARAHLLVRDTDSTRTRAVVATTGTPPELGIDGGWVSYRHAEWGGLVARAGRIWLAARLGRTSGPDSAQDVGPPFVEVWVPVDSLYLADLAGRHHVDLRLTAVPNLFIGTGIVNTGGDSVWTEERVEVGARFRPLEPNPSLADRREYLARTLLPAGNWWRETTGRTGSVVLTLETAPRYFAGRGLDMVNFLTGNAFSLAFLMLAAILVAITEGMAVRTGRSILKSILEEVTLLRDAARRFGLGDLKHRIKVEGADEIATVAGALNDMAAGLERQQAELVEKRRLEADLALARDIQKRLLPQGPPAVGGLDVAGVSIPSLEVGGDLFAFFTPGDGRLGLALGDVSGKSVPAAILMSNTLAVLRAEAALGAGVNESLVQMNRVLREQVEVGRFVTLVYGTIDGATGAVELASAGHNPALLVTEAGAVEWIEASGPPLGVLDEVDYPAAVRRLEPGDVLVLYSDGITEAGRTGEGSEMEFFEEERLAAVVRENRSAPAAGLLEAVLRAVGDFRGAEPQGDDVTLVVVRRTGAAPDTSPPATGRGQSAAPAPPPAPSAPTS